MATGPRRLRRGVKRHVPKWRPGDYDKEYITRHEFFTPEGQVIDKDILNKYLKEVKESEGFYISEYPGQVMGVTDVMPLQSVLDNRDEHLETYENVMDLAAMAVKRYNIEYGRNFKVAEIEKLNVDGSSGTSIIYYITFTAVDVRRPFLSSLFGKLLTTLQILMWTLILWIFYIPLIAPAYRLDLRLKLKLLKLKSAQELKARKEELEDECAVRWTFEALALDDEIYMEREIKFCRVARKKFCRDVKFM